MDLVFFFFDLILRVPGATFDLSPFFSRPSAPGGSRSAASHIFEGFSQLLTEMALRLPYLVKKVALARRVAEMARPEFDDVSLLFYSKVDPSVVLDRSWVDCLCEYVAAPTPSQVKRHVRKLLLFHCGSKEHYRQVKKNKQTKKATNSFTMKVWLDAQLFVQRFLLILTHSNLF